MKKNKKSLGAGIFLAGMLFTQTALAYPCSDCEGTPDPDAYQACIDGCSNSTESGSGGWNVDSVRSFNLPDASIFNIVTRILKWLLAVLGMVGVIGFAISGIMYLTAAGDEKQITRAKTAMMYSIIGVIVGICGVVVIQAVDLMLRAGGGVKF